MKSSQNNFAFIDSQNLNLGIRDLGWILDYKKFRVYLTEKYGIGKAYLFIGFVALNQGLYDKLQEAGFLLFLSRRFPMPTARSRAMWMPTWFYRPCWIIQNTIKP